MLAIQLAGFFGLISVMRAATLPTSSGQVSNATEYFNEITRIPLCRTLPHNLPEFRTFSDPNIFWTVCVSDPKVKYQAADLAYSIHHATREVENFVPGQTPLTRGLYVADSGIGMEVRPTAVGPGYFERQDPTWYLPGYVVTDALQALEIFYRKRTGQREYEPEFYIYEKDRGPYSRSRGTVVVGYIGKVRSEEANGTEVFS